MTKKLALTWQLTEVHGWGLVGVHTALYLTECGAPPLLLEKPAMHTLRPKNRELLQPLEGNYNQVVSLVAQNPNQVFLLREYDVLHALGNGFSAGPSSTRFRGNRNVGVIAFEDTLLNNDVMARARSYDRIVVHSHYNLRLLQERGLPSLGLALQGIDPTEMVFKEPTGRFGDRFVVFSGGKLEFRKGQDIVLAAFRQFHQRHPEALLVTNWFNAWPHLAAGMTESPLTPVAPTTDEKGQLKIGDWAIANGLPPGAHIDLGFLGRDQISAMLAECHAAVFPNRCEGATNLVAMEAMACNVPVILSANTGHLDLIRDGNSLALTRQQPVRDPTGARIDWGESSVDELVEHLETLFTDRARAKAQAATASAFIRGERTWRAFAESFVDACG